MVETGVIFGRYQIFHLKHMEGVLAAKMRCNKLYIGITHPDIVAYAAASPLDVNGVTKMDNPLTYFERMEMIQGALRDFGVKRKEFEVIPFPVSQPDLITQYAPKDATYYMSICTPWDEEKYRILQSQGLKIEVLWRRNPEEMGMTGKMIRQLITSNSNEWQQHVPRSVAEYIIEHGIDLRIREQNQLYAIPIAD
ncbi:nucleotidyl transferase family protein [Mediterraneibacter agrestimuris]|uniref:nicotinate-nucleotide adenylyltransferase n=1 Tax=Mediterraneibacter agrestimuris TaxID=2941333 RepID=UPI0020405AEE|nr:nicotinate-nucleotide adenylyltransferase [Mediterraneibacter agrestimuris]